MNGLDEATLSPFRVRLKKISDQITSEELCEMKFLLKEHMSERKREAAVSCLQLFQLLEKAGLLTDGRTDLLRNVLDQLPRRDLVLLLDGYGTQRKAMAEYRPEAAVAPVQHLGDQLAGTGFAVPACPRTTPPPTQESSRQTCMAGSPAPTQESSRQTCTPTSFYTQPPLQEEGKSFHLPTPVQSAEQTLSCQTLFNGLPNTVATDGPTDQLAPSVIDTKQNTMSGNLANPTMGNYREKVLRIKEQKVQPKPHNYLEVGGYRVGIVGGRHYEIEEEEFVEMDHGSTYHIKLTNSHHRSCDAQLWIDGKDVGTWRLDPKQEIELERPEDEQMCFTFFSTRMAPAEADITRGSEENGLVEVTFTPEKAREEMKTTAKDPYRGGEQGTEDDTTSSDSSSDDDEPFRSAMPQNWSSGATALQGVSGQEFEEVEGDMERDEGGQVVLMLRLVARTDAPQVKVSTAPVKPLKSKRPRALPD